MPSKRIILRVNDDGTYSEVREVGPKQQAKSALKDVGDTLDGVRVAVFAQETDWYDLTVKTTKTTELKPVKGEK